MKFCWCTIGVKDMDASVKFYQEIVGLHISRRFAAGPGLEICFMGDGETKVELICGPNYKPPADPEGLSLGFETKSVDEMITFIAGKGLAVAKGPFQPNPHIKFFYVKDPDGVNIQFVENM
ncbi:MAG: glyoxalase [Elusimicrobia bacterium CG_4_10_14_0_2_um_filter_56_8]|nr:MAG: glyoxalase [Elusimicrobia bacterium CG1_02_56_21]PJA14533.1 MAG: glyoxalase [Elusimicrobia bacterium CG_4_10_14_0_2_um_filter_56_8]